MGGLGGFTRTCFPTGAHRGAGRRVARAEKRLPARPVQLPRRLWKLALGLAALPVCSLAAVVLLATRCRNQPEAYAVSMAMGLAVLPVVLLTSVVLLASFTLLAEHEALEQAGRLAALREAYYQGLQGQEGQVRRLCHDLRNHLTALQGLLARGQTKAADDYLKQLLDSAALHGRRRLCENETADIVLSAKAQAMEQAGVNARFGVSLPNELPLAPTDLCALLGNALDNALEAARRTPEGWVSVRARADKGLLMLRVENTAPGLPVREKTAASPPPRRTKRPRLRAGGHGGDCPPLRRHLAGRSRAGALLPAGQSAFRAKLNRPSPALFGGLRPAAAGLRRAALPHFPLTKRRRVWYPVPWLAKANQLFGFEVS